MQDVLLTAATLIGSRSYGSLPISSVKSKYMPQLTLVNIALREFVGSDKSARLKLLSTIFNRPLTTSLDLTVGEVQAFLALAYPAQSRVMSEKFHAYLLETLSEEETP